MSVAEIEAAIKSLPREDLAHFNQWYQEFWKTSGTNKFARMFAQAGLIFYSKKRGKSGRLARSSLSLELDLHRTILGTVQCAAFPDSRLARKNHELRVGDHYRALAEVNGSQVTWFWIGHHAAYDQILR